jgi:hypothetical protein
MLKLATAALSLALVPSAVVAAPSCAPARAGQPLVHTSEVKEIISQLAALRESRLDEDRKLAAQQQLFARLERLGSTAIPAIIAQMDDRRPLAVQQISLENRFPGAFESVRHYGPELIVDALDAILNQITGQSFGFIGNGGSDEDRRRAVIGWQSYAAKLACQRGHRRR